MKRILWAAGFILALVPLCRSDDYQNNRSTNATSAVTTPYIAFAHPGDILGAILVNKRSASSETITVYDASGTAGTSLGIIDLSTGAGSTALTGNEYVYNLLLSSGISFSKSGSNSDVTIIWRNKSGRP